MTDVSHLDARRPRLRLLELKGGRHLRRVELCHSEEVQTFFCDDVVNAVRRASNQHILRRTLLGRARRPLSNCDCPSSNGGVPEEEKE
jgi:hypothetical protein